MGSSEIARKQRYDPKLSILLYESLRAPAWLGFAGCCDVCFTHLSQLKREAIHMLLNQNRTIWPNSSPASVSPGYHALGSHTLPRAIGARSPSPNKRHKFSNPRTETWVREHSRFDTLWGANNEMAPFADTVSQDGMKKKKDDEATVLCRFRGPLTFNTSKVAAMLPAGTTAAFSFIVRAVQKLKVPRAIQKLHWTSRRRKQGSDNDCYPTNFCGLLQKEPPPAPLNLFQTHSKSRELPETPKVRVMLRLNPILPADTSQSHALKVDLHKKQVTVLEPFIQSTQRSAAGAPFTPKTFTFDATFGPESSQARVCERSLCEVLQAVVAGADGCVLSFGQTKVGTSYTMIGRDSSTPNLGIIPCAISWLFRLIKKKTDKTWANISVSVSAVEVCGETEVIRDLLSGFEASDHTHKPNVYLQEDPVCGIQLYNNRVVSAPTAERAACLLDAALASRNTGMAGCRGTFHHHCHMFYTLHVCQKHIESSPTSGMYVEQSKLSLIDLGGCTRERTKNNTEVCLLDLGNVIMAKLNGHKHVPNKGSKLAMLMQESLGNVNCHTTIVAHVSTAHEDLSETLCTIQTVSRLRRFQKIRKQACSSPGARSLGREKKVSNSSKLRAFRYAGSLEHNFSLPHLLDDLEDHSGSDNSCDTVFCVDPKSVLHDKEVRRNQEFVPIIPSLQRNKAELRSPFSIKHCDILQFTQNSKAMKKRSAQHYSSAPDLECFKCNTFAELQNRLGSIDESEVVGLNSCKIQPANAAIRSEPQSSKVLKIPAEKPELRQFPCKKQANDQEHGQSRQRGAFMKNIKEIPYEHPGQDKILPCSTRFLMASSSVQCERDTDSQSLTKTMDTAPSVPFSVEGLSSDKSTLPPKIRVPPVGKSSSSLSTALGSTVLFPITRCEVIPQFPTENQGEKATITVTVQQPLDLNGHDELIYSVVKEVEVGGPVSKGKAAKMANVAELNSLKNLPLGSQPVKIIGSVGKEQTAAECTAEVEALGTIDDTSSDLSAGKTISVAQSHVANSKTDNKSSQLDVRSKESQSEIAIVVAKTDFVSTSQYEASRFREHTFETAAKQEDAETNCNQSSGQLCKEFKDKVPLTNHRILEDFQMKPKEILASSCYSTYETRSLTRASLDADIQHTCTDAAYPCTSWKNETLCSPKATLEKKCYVAKPSLQEWAKYNKSMPLVTRTDNNSPNKKTKKHVQPTLTQTTSENQLKTTNPKSPFDESTKLFSAKLEQLTSRNRSLSRSYVECAAVPPFMQSNTVFPQDSSRSMEGSCTPPRVNRHLEKENCQDLGSKGNLEGQYASAHAKSTACPGLLTVFEADLLTLSQANHSLRRVPRFFPLYDVDESDTCKPSQSNISSANKVLSSPVVHKLSGTAPNLCASPKSNRRSINRSSSLSPDAFSRKQISWSSQSLSRKQTKASISSKYPTKILNGRVEVLRASEDSLSSSSQGSSDIDDLEESKRKMKLLSHTLPSPYSRVTAPRKPSHCSGHTSDNTSVLSGELPPAMCKTALLYSRNSMVSSGYESLKRDSETTYSSTSIHDSISEQSCFYNTLNGARSSKKKSNTGSHQRHPSQDTLSSLRRSVSGSKIRWVDRGTSDAYEIKVYEIDNVDSLQRRGKAGNKSVVCFSAKLKFLEHRQQRIAAMRAKYHTLKRELELVKRHLMMDPEKWTHEFDLWQTFEVDSLEHLEALELMTQRLEWQVFRCKAHVMMVTSFDASPKRRLKKKYRPPVDYMGFLGI